MMERENVIRDLRYVKSFGRVSNNPQLTEIAETALELLKEQEPVKPRSKSRHGEYPQIVHRCGNCNEILYRYYKYCPTCGRSVKWE